MKRGWLAGPRAALRAGAATALAIALLGGGLELAARRLWPALQRPPHVWPPLLSWELEPRPELLPGVAGPSRFTASSEGFRGPERTGAERVQVLALGGSATECLYLDDAEAWPSLLADELRGRSGLARGEIWVGGAGKSGLGSRETLVQARALADRFPAGSVWVILSGVNDLQLRLAQDQGYDPGAPATERGRRELERRAFSAPPWAGTFLDGLSLPYLARAAGYRLLRSGWIGEAPPSLASPDRAGETYLRRRQWRREARRFLDELPDLGAALAEYRGNLEETVRVARSHGIEALLLTQPALWRVGLPRDRADLLWFGGKGWFTHRRSEEYYSVAALRRGLDLYNRELLRACAASGARCLDLAAQVDPDPGAFYDDVHFSESGARRVAREVAEALARSRPLWLGASPAGGARTQFK